jgi:hypothetical protein
VPKPPPDPSFIDAIPFELTDFEDARHALNELPDGVEILTQSGEAYWQRRRRKPLPTDSALSSGALHWLAQLPFDLQPRKLAEKFPRLVNQIAASWSSDFQSAAELDGLIIDRRGGRRGFALEVQAELRLLRKHIEAQMQR